MKIQLAAQDMQVKFASLPIEGQSAMVEWAEFMTYFGEMCAFEGGVLNCPDSKEVVAEKELDDVINELDACGLKVCDDAGDALVNFIDTIDECRTELPENYSQMIKLTVPNVTAQEKLTKDVYEIQAAFGNWTNTTEFANLKKYSLKWAMTEEF